MVFLEVQLDMTDAGYGCGVWYVFIVRNECELALNFFNKLGSSQLYLFYQGLVNQETRIGQIRGKILLLTEANVVDFFPIVRSFPSYCTSYRMFRNERSSCSSGAGKRSYSNNENSVLGISVKSEHRVKLKFTYLNTNSIVILSRFIVAYR